MRDYLVAASNDPARRNEAIRRILQLAAASEPKLALQFLELLKPFASDPVVAQAIGEIHARIPRPQTDAVGPVLAANVIADAQHYNSAHPDNVATFASRVQEVNVAGVVDVGRVVKWQQGKGLEADGKIGPATLQASSREHDAAKTSPETATHGATGGGGHHPTAEYDAATLAAHASQEAAFDAADVADPFFRSRFMVNVSPTEVFNAITHKAKGISHVFRALMTGQATGEQGHRANHYNFMGYEFSIRGPFGKPPKGRPWTRDFRSDRITPAEYHANPTYFYTMRSYGKTIAQQLSAGATEIYCTWYAPRPVYASIDEAAGRFVSGIVGWRLAAFQKSPHPHHHDVAARALAGDIEAYLELVETRDSELGVLAYNGTNLYKGLMRPILAKAKTELASVPEP